MKKTLLVLVSICISLPFFVSADNVITDCTALQGTTDIAKITALTLNKYELSMNRMLPLADRQFQLEAYIYPIFASLDQVTWSSSSSLVTVDQTGLVTATSTSSYSPTPIDVVVTASTAEGVSVSCTIHLVSY